MVDRAAGGGFGRRRRYALAAAALLLAALLALWLARKPIATRYVDRTLAAAKVPARYTIADLGLGGQRLTNVVIGDPARPDLVADWIETRTRIGLGGPELAGVRAGRLRLRGRLVDGRLSLGAIDRLLPASTGGAFALPRLDLSVEDGRMRLETPWGIVGASLRGRGRLDGVFDGRLALASERIGVADCAAERVAAVFHVRAGGSLTLAGPLNGARLRCAGATAADWRSDVTADILTGRRRGSTVRLRAATGALVHRLARADRATAAIDVVHDGGEAFTVRSRIAARSVRGAGAGAETVTFDGTLRNAADGTLDYAGRLGVADADASALVPAFAGRAAGTPLAPLVDRLATAARAAARRFSGEAEIAVGTRRALAVTIPSAALDAASGARLRFGNGSGIGWRQGQPPVIDGTLAVGGGGLPSATAAIAQARVGARRIVLTMAPYRADGARLALTPVTIADGRVATRATLSGPLGDGRVEGLTLPLDLQVRAGTIVAGPACTPIGFDRLAVSGLVLAPARLRLCPTGPALVRVAGGRVDGGARLAATRLAGRLATTPVALDFAGATLRLADRDFALDGVETRLGAPDRVTRLAFARLEGRAGQDGVAGRFAGGAGRIANVPLLLSDAAGDWRFVGGRLTLTGALRVADAQAASPRFHPMAARNVALGLEHGEIVAVGALHEPTSGTRVATVAIRHALGPGTGEATLEVPNLTFAKAFGPDLLTPLTYGVVADVAGTVSGAGHVAWGAQGVTSTGTFRTAGIDLAAAFGPVTGLAGEIRFTDLLGLESAPGQVATIASVNPGIAVTGGTVRYRLLPGTRVRVEGGEWPFAGGRLTLDPTLLDFAGTAERRMTFRVDGVAADRFLQQFDFKNLDATGTFDGVLPMVFDTSGGRIENGRMGVREGGGTIAYVGELTEKQLGFWGDFAFQALKSLRYRSLSLAMNGPLAGEMVTDVRFEGIRQGQGARSNILIRRLQRLPLVFNVRIKAPFRGLIDSVQSFYDPGRSLQRDLPGLIHREIRVQPPASVPVPKKD